MLEWDDYGGIRKFLDDCWEKFKSDEPEPENADISRYSRKVLTGRMARLMESLLEQYNLRNVFSKMINMISVVNL